MRRLARVSENEVRRRALVILEGHVRLTAYFLSRRLPDELPVVFGDSPNMRSWPLY